MPSPTHAHRLVALASLVLAVGVSGRAVTADRDAELERQLRKATTKINRSYCRDLDRNVIFAAAKGLKKEATELLERIHSIDPEYRNLKKLRARVAEAKAPSSEEQAEKDRKTLASRMKRADVKQAKDLMNLAKGCMRVGLFTRAYDMVQSVIKIDPENKTARKVLSYTWDRKQKKWISTWEAGMRRKHFLTAEGWFEKRDEKKFEKGLRPYKGSWIPKEREREIRSRNEYNPFAVETEHFRVETNLGREQAFHFAKLLEDYYGEFFRVFIGYFDQKTGARLLFNQANLKKKHLVYLFPSRTDYLVHVKAEKGNDKLLRESAGFYSSSDRKSRFYWSESLESVYHTLYHEVAHQLFAETKPTVRGGSRGNNWVVEGIASYMETWKKVDGQWRPGAKIDGDRMQHAQSFLAQYPDWDLAAFVAIDHEQFHRTNRGLNYSLAGALSHFFMHYDDEAYKEDFVRFVAAYYEGKVTRDSLAEYIQVEGAKGNLATFQVLEKQFKQYMRDLGKEKPPEEEDDAVGSSE